ncbi:hypothetical protein [Serratia marcescens]|uniref:hypothetical protein n=1 Tax=Serratia marcescens TaxID=615 RepID=UPI001B95DF03|nr:hypothetical protein [Serratia marcescens]CAI1950609.1 Uncharacterised protein [Serratia marcescens]HBC7417612.1 hypothetical protein [Serratia marcescens]
MRISKRIINSLVVGAVTALTACADVSFTHANGAKGQSVTNAEVQANSTVVMTYPNGSACIDTHPGESAACGTRGQ